MTTRWIRFAALAFGALALSPPALATAQVFIYPARGQSPQQEQFDRGQCYSWAVQQSGFDPANPQWTSRRRRSVAIASDGEGWLMFGACTLSP